MKKRKQQKYLEYDYEAAYQKSLHDLEEANAERMLKSGYVKSIYATKEIRAGDVLDVEIYPEFTRKQKDKIPFEQILGQRSHPWNALPRGAVRPR